MTDTGLALERVGASCRRGGKQWSGWVAQRSCGQRGVQAVDAANGDPVDQMVGHGIARGLVALHARRQGSLQIGWQ